VQFFFYTKYLYLHIFAHFCTKLNFWLFGLCPAYARLMLAYHLAYVGLSFGLSPAYAWLIMAYQKKVKKKVKFFKLR